MIQELIKILDSDKEYQEHTQNLLQQRPGNPADFDSVLQEHMLKLDNGGFSIDENNVIHTFYNSDVFHKYLLLDFNDGYLRVMNSMCKKPNRVKRELRIPTSYAGYLLDTARKFYNKAYAEIQKSKSITNKTALTEPIRESFCVSNTQVVLEINADSAAFGNVIKMYIVKSSVDTFQKQSKFNLYQWLKVESLTDVVHIVSIILEINKKIQGDL